MDIAIGPGSHVCHLFSGFNEQKQVALPFIRDGIAANEHCLFTVFEHTVDDWLLELQAFGVDVRSALDDRALAVLHEEDARPPSEFNAIQMARDLWHLLQPLLGEFAGIRLLREVPWQGPGALTVENLCQMEVTGDLLVEDNKLRALCQYDLTRHPPGAIHTALRTHRWVVLGEQMYENPFYETRRILDNEPLLYGSVADARMVDEMLLSFRRDASR